MSINQNDMIGVLERLRYPRFILPPFETFQFHRLHFNHDFVGEGKQ